MFFILQIWKKNCLLNIRMINLSLNKLKPIGQSRNISDYENGYEKDLIKALSKPKRKIIINKNKPEEIRKYFKELMYKFSKKGNRWVEKSFVCHEKLHTSFYIRNKKGKQKSY